MIQCLGVKWQPSCDACGEDAFDKDEILCRKCWLKNKIKQTQKTIDLEFGSFTRLARGNPPRRELYVKKMEYEKELKEILGQ
jgi:hypothetical protein